MEILSDIQTERVIAEAVRSGSAKAFEIVYRLYIRRLYAYCYEVIRVRQETEEVVHDVFMALWNSREAIDSSLGVGRLLFAIARRKRIDAFRRIVNSPIYEDYVEHANSISSTDAAPMEYDEFRKALFEAIGRMPRRPRQIITLSRVDGLSNDEIALRLGLSEKTVRNQLSLALRQLHDHIALLINNNPAQRHK